MKLRTGLCNVTKLVTDLAFGLIASIEIVGYARIKTTSITLSATKVSTYARTMRHPVVVIWFEGPLLTPSISRMFRLCVVGGSYQVLRCCLQAPQICLMSHQQIMQLLKCQW